METISPEDFARVDLRVGRVVAVDEFPEARRPAWILHVDLGPELGVRKSSAQLTAAYPRAEDLVGRLVVAVVNLPPKQVGPLLSRCLVTGFTDEHGHVRLCVPDADVPLGTRLF